MKVNILIMAIFFLTSIAHSETDYANGSKAHRDACYAWCSSQDRCTHCSSIKNCGLGYERIRLWDGYGEDWAACTPNGEQSFNAMWDNHKRPNENQTVLLISVGGSGGSTGNDGMENFCKDFIWDKGYPSIYCYGSYANVTTNSGDMADNIVSLIDDMTAISGVVPTVILVGKSMGGCKLHHAVAGEENAWDRNLKNRVIDMFIGVDMSCTVNEHTVEGMKEALVFKKNVKRLLNFYQTKDHGAFQQTGHYAVFTGDTEINWTRQINVNNESFSALTMEKQAGSLCSNAGHDEIDYCSGLRWLINDLVMRKAKLGRFEVPEDEIFSLIRNIINQ